MPRRSSRRYGLLNRFFRRSRNRHRLLERCDLDFMLRVGCAYVHRCLLDLLKRPNLSLIGISRQKLQSESDGKCPGFAAPQACGLDEARVLRDFSCSGRFSRKPGGKTAESMSRRRRPQLAAVAAACIAAGVVAACGGTTQSQPGGIGQSGAALVDSGALAFVAVDGDLSSSRWQQLDALVKKFPVRDKFLAELKRGLATQQIDYE